MHIHFFFSLDKFHFINMCLLYLCVMSESFGPCYLSEVIEKTGWCYLNMNMTFI